jgi:hypothetical protein
LRSTLRNTSSASRNRLIVTRLSQEDIDIALEILDTGTAVAQSRTPVPHDDAFGLGIEEHGMFLRGQLPIEVIPLGLELVEHRLSFFQTLRGVGGVDVRVLGHLLMGIVLQTRFLLVETVRGRKETRGTAYQSLSPV